MTNMARGLVLFLVLACLPMLECCISAMPCYPVSVVILDVDEFNHESSEKFSSNHCYKFHFQSILRKYPKILSIGDSDNINGDICDSHISCYQKIEQACSPSLLPLSLASYSTYGSLQEAIRIWTKEKGNDLIVRRL